MARRLRQDGIGTWHHVFSRGLARRVIFEDRRDLRYFKSCLARETRRGTIKVLCFSLLTTHFHLLVVSVTGELGEAMKRVLNRYSRYFNRRYRRDGSLFRSRFQSRPVLDLAYKRAVIRYIDRNAVQARLARFPWDYAWGSAAKYCGLADSPWLRHAEVPDLVAQSMGCDECTPQVYEAFYRKMKASDVDTLVEGQLSGIAPDPECLDDLIAAAPDRVRSWMLRKASVADGRRVGNSICSVGSIIEAVCAAGLDVEPGDLVKRGRPKPRRSQVLKVGTLRLLAGISWTEMEAKLSIPESTCRRLARVHLKLLKEDAEYAHIAQLLVSQLLLACHGR